MIKNTFLINNPTQYRIKLFHYMKHRPGLHFNPSNTINDTEMCKNKRKIQHFWGFFCKIPLLKFLKILIY